MVEIKTDEELKKLNLGGNILAQILKVVQKTAVAGISALELDTLAEKEILRNGATPSFKGYKGFSNTLCVSINEEVVHGIPTSDKILQNGDIVGLDLGLWFQGLCTDAAVTIPIGKINKQAKKLLAVTKKALHIGIKQAKVGNTTGDIGYAIQQYAESKNFAVVRDLVGHGVGRKVHEDPYVPNYGKKGSGVPLRRGMVIAIEPMLTVGGYDVVLQDDGWTYATADGGLAAQFEHTIAITEKGPIILTQ